MKKIILIVVLMFILTACTENIIIEPEDFVLEAYQDLNLTYTDNSDFILLPESFYYVNVSWDSSNPDIINLDGTISRVLVDTNVTLTATLTKDDQTMIKTFIINVKGEPYSDLEIVELDQANLSFESYLVSSNLTLPRFGTYGSVIAWQSQYTNVIGNNGVYYMPIDETEVIMTATIIYGNESLTKEFTFTAQAMSDEGKIERDALMLFVPSSVTQDIVLPKRGYFGSDIVWTSSDPDIIDSNGKFIYPIGNHIVTLTATITKGDATMDKVFQTNVEGDDLELFLEKSYDLLQVNHGIEVIFEDVILPLEVNDHATVTWESDHEEILSSTGSFTIPLETTRVTLTATLRALDQEVTKDFIYTIYGTNDELSEETPQNLSSILYSGNFPVYYDSGERLALGSFNDVMYKNNHLLLLGSKLEGTYTSPVIETDTDFIRANIIWGSITDSRAKTEMEVRYMTAEGFSDWTSLGIWGYGGPNQPPRQTVSYAIGSNQFQYRIHFTRTSLEVSSPELTHVSISFVYQGQDFSYDRELLRQSVLYDVPQLRQADTIDPFLWNNICWATSISMMLQYYDKLTDLKVPQEYYSVLIRQGTEQFGTSKNDIGATQFGLGADLIEFQNEDMLLYFLDHYGPLLVGVSKGESPTGKFGPLTYSSGHVIVVVGYEIKTDGTVDIHVNDPAVSWMRYVITGSLSEFMLVWDHGGLYVHTL